MELGFGNQDDSVNGATHVFWSMVWIDDAGIKFNQSKLGMEMKQDFLV